MNTGSTDPKIWGPSGWIFLHSVTKGYPECPTEEDKRVMKDFFIKTGKVLPCERCRANYSLHLIKYPLTNEILASRQKLEKWLLNIHNEVNKQLEKKESDIGEEKKVMLIINISMLVLLVIVGMIIILRTK